MKPLLEHVIDAPVDAGFFVSQLWNRQSDRAPTAAEAMRADPWHGWSIVSFWKTVQESQILRVQFAPSEPNFDGPVYVLVDRSAASATELAADAFRASGAAILVGERTAGEMLSQSMFDVGDGFIVSLPVADYYSLKHGRIEGSGVPVDVEVPPDLALDHVIELINGRFGSHQSRRLNRPSLRKPTSVIPNSTAISTARPRRCTHSRKHRHAGHCGFLHEFETRAAADDNALVARGQCIVK